MLDQLEQDRRAAGVKQVRKAVLSGQAAGVFLARDADPLMTEPIEALCRERNVPVEYVPAMRELGHRCGLKVGCAAAALIRSSTD